METKVCTKCKEEKTFDMFSKKNRGKYGLDSRCKRCVYKINSEYKKNNPEKISFYRKENHKENREKYLLRSKEWRNENPEKTRILGLKYCNGLSDSYIIRSLKDTGFTTDQIKENPELIEIKKLIIKTKRLCKTSQN